MRRVRSHGVPPARAQHPRERRRRRWRTSLPAAVKRCVSSAISESSLTRSSHARRRRQRGARNGGSVEAVEGAVASAVDAWVEESAKAEALLRKLAVEKLGEDLQAVDDVLSGSLITEVVKAARSSGRKRGDSDDVALDTAARDVLRPFVLKAGITRLPQPHVVPSERVAVYSKVIADLAAARRSIRAPSLLSRRRPLRGRRRCSLWRCSWRSTLAPNRSALPPRHDCRGSLQNPPSALRRARAEAAAAAADEHSKDAGRRGQTCETCRRTDCRGRKWFRSVLVSYIHLERRIADAVKSGAMTSDAREGFDAIVEQNTGLSANTTAHLADAGVFGSCRLTSERVGGEGGRRSRDRRVNQRREPRERQRGIHRHAKDDGRDPEEKLWHAAREGQEAVARGLVEAGRT